VKRKNMDSRVNGETTNTLVPGAVNALTERKIKAR